MDAGETSGILFNVGGETGAKSLPYILNKASKLFMPIAFPLIVSVMIIAIITSIIISDITIVPS